MFRAEDFEEIRPYKDEEINPALRRVLSESNFGTILKFFFPEEEHLAIIKELESVDSSISFQKKFMYPLINSIVKRTSSGLTCTGFERLTPGVPYLFIANHRDIVLDSAILQVILFDYRHSTSEISFGSNLMINQFVIDLGKVNRMFKVERSGNKEELLRNSQTLSAYLRYTINDKRTSAWIAQRPGRTKDGFDKTETGLLKMLNMSGTGGFRNSFSELNIVPITISYEMEPCCARKINEVLTIKKTGTYKKEPGEDLQSIISGITEFKGRINLSAGRQVNEFLDEIPEKDPLNVKITKLAELIDFEIYRNYKLWPFNFLAFDMLHSANDNSDFYTLADKGKFLQYLEEVLNKSKGERRETEKLFLTLYANPVANRKRAG